MDIFNERKERKEKKFKNDCKEYKKKFNSITNIEELEFERIKLDKEKKIVSDPTIYLSIVISIFAIAISIKIAENKPVDWGVIVGTVFLLFIGTGILLGLNTRNSRENEVLLWKSEIIKIRIEELKQEELNKKREIELNKVLNHENDTLIKKIIKFLRIN